MTTQEAFEQFYTELAVLYDHTEAQLVALYVFQDVFQMKHQDIGKDFSQESVKKLMVIQDRLLAHEPWQHVVGFADFFGMKFHVSRDVLIPRPETEGLIALVLASLQKGQSVLDIGTGSGCIPIILKKEFPESVITSADISPQALAIARDNANTHDVDIDLREIDILDQDSWKTFEGKQFDIIVSNPPYVLENEKKSLETRVVDFDPALALFVPEKDPLIFYKAIADFATQFLSHEGMIFF